MSGFRIEGNSSGNVVEVNAANQLKVVLETSPGANPGNVGGARLFCENDAGSRMGTAYLRSPEVDEDYRLRVGQDSLIDAENLYYGAQNTGKHRYGNSTITITWGAGGVTLNGTNVTTASTGCELRTWAYFPVFGSGRTYYETIAAFTAQPTVNVIVEFGAGLTNSTGTAAPTDGAYFRLTSSGLSCVVVFNGAETEVNVPGGWSYTNNQACKFGITVTLRECEFWIDDVRVARIAAVTAVGTGFSASALPWFAQQRHPAVAASAFQTKLFSYLVSLGGLNPVTDFDDVGNSLYGSYQGLSGFTMGTLANFANSANPTAAVPTNTTAALGSGLGGQFWETDTLAVTTDGIICSYVVPSPTIVVPGRRLCIKGIKIDSFVQTALTGGGYNAVWSLAFGHTSISLATAEGASAKAPRRIPLGVQTVAAGAVALTQLQSVLFDFTRPVIVNPGEMLQVVKKKVGAAPSAGVIAHIITFDYGWI